MLVNAKNSINDWSKVSVVNKSFSLGSAWNVLASGFKVETKHHKIYKTNLIREFGSYLDKELKPVKRKNTNTVKVHHQEPNFENW